MARQGLLFDRILPFSYSLFTVLESRPDHPPAPLPMTQQPLCSTFIRHLHGSLISPGQMAPFASDSSLRPCHAELHPGLQTYWSSESESESHSVMSDSLRLHGMSMDFSSLEYWSSLSLLQRIFPTQESNPGLPHCRWILYQLSYQGSPGALPLPIISQSCFPSLKDK